MAQECGFFNAKLVGEDEYDRVYLAEQFAAYFASFIGNGVFGKSMQKLEVISKDVPDMTVQVLPGEAWINGWWYRNTDSYILNIQIADGVLSRIDAIVLRWGNVERDIWLTVITGEPSVNPQAPALSRNADYYDLCLGYINVSAGSINITQAQITDTRLDNSVCGLVTGVVDQIDTTNLYNQFTAYFNEFKQGHEAAFDNWTADKKADWSEWVDGQEAEFTQWALDEKGAFEEWLELIKDQLSEDAAGNLQNQIYSINAVLREITESEIDEIIQGTYESDSEGGIEPDIYSRVTSEEIENAVNNGFEGSDES